MHTKDDNFESFFHVLYWVALRHCEHTESNDDLEDFLAINYGKAVTGLLGHSFPRSRLDMMVNERNNISSKGFGSPLRDILTAFQRIVNKRYCMEPSELQLFKSWVDQISNDRGDISEATYV